MKAILHRFLWPFRAPGSGLIEVDESGWWKRRCSPTRSLKEAARLFNELGGQVIVEIGSGLHGDLAGNSILTWARHTSAKRILAVDHDIAHIRQLEPLARRHHHVEPIHADAFDFLSS